MKTLTKIALTAAASLLLSSNAMAITYSFEDTWKDWNNGNASSVYQKDQHGNPSVNKMLVTVDQGYLKKVDIVFNTNAREMYESLFINTSYATDQTWDDWDYFVRNNYGSGHQTNTAGTEAKEGIYTVNSPSNYVYTTTIDGGGWDVREKNPNGIAADSLLKSLIIPYSVSPLTMNSSDNLWYLTYSFDNGIKLNNGFFIAWAPWCANDVIGGGVAAPVPEPTTMLLFGTGLIGLAGIARRWQNA